MINDRELLLATANRKKEERILYYAYFVGESINKVLNYYGFKDYDELASNFGFFNRKCVSPKRKEDAPVYDYSKYFKDINIPSYIQIGVDGVLNLPGSNHHFTHLISPLRDIYDEEELYNFPIYKNPEHFDFSNMKSEVDAIHKKESVAYSGTCRFFETAWAFRGYENMLADMMVDKDIANYFLDIELKWNLEFVQQAVLAGVDMLVFGDDVGNQNCMTFSAELWREMLKPRWDKLFSLAKKLNPNIVLWYHSCGNITDIVPDLIDVGLDILNPVQPECMDMYGTFKKYGDRLSFDGGIGTQSTLPFGTVSDVINETKKVVDIMGANGGLILSPTHLVEPEVPIENIDAFIKTAQKICNRR